MKNQPLNFVSLFAGIGGIDLGLERAGMRCVAQVEIDPFCRRVLAKHWPDVPRFEDVRTVTAADFTERVDLIAGGFPCQDISNMGAKDGLDGERSGLWFEYLRIIRAVRPRFVLVENVAALLNRGLDRVLSGLADSGFDAEWSVLSACALGAPHTRERVFVVAHREGCGRVSASFAEARRREADDAEAREKQAIASGGRNRSHRRGWWVREPEVARMVDGSAAEVDGPNRAIGRIVVPQVAEWIGRRIVEAAESEAAA